MSATTLDVPALNSSVPESVRTTNVSVTCCEQLKSIDEIRPGDREENVRGRAFADRDDDAVSGNMVGLLDNIISAEFNVDGDDDDVDDEALEETKVVRFTCKEDT